MITSLIDLLRDCLPIHAAWTEAEMLSGRIGEVPPASNLKRLMQAQAPGASAVVPAQPLPSNDPKGWWQKIKSNFGLSAAVLSTRLWSWTLQGPNKVVQMNCRAREAGYRLHAVLPQVTLGLDGDPKLKLTTASGDAIELPLTAEFLFTQFFVQGGTIPKGKRTLWPLEALHDSGIVLVFIYEPNLDGQGKIKLPLSPFQPSGAGNWRAVHIAERTLLEGLAPSVPDKDGWLEAMTGPFMRVPGDDPQTTAQTNDTRTRKVVRPRIVVALSVATCRERADFEPGGLVGMAKIFPTIMVSSALPLATLEGTVKIERTPATTPLDNGNGAMAAGTTCCGAQKEVGAILVADANEIGGITQKPFWGGTFAYFEPQADARFTGKRLKFVDRSKTTPRTFHGGTRLLVRRLQNPFGTDYWASLFGLRSQELKGVEKAPRQGEFDNLHLAPSLKLDLAKWVYIVPGGGDGFTPPTVFENTVDPATCHTDKVWMAPFCSHDCFHTHTRWGAKESAEWTMGWNETGPYKVSGAPMVPLHQDVWLELHGPSSYSYHVTSTYDAKHVPGTWDVLMHHGAAYAQSIADWTKFAGSQINVGLEQTNAQFYDSAGRRITLDNAPLMYWLFRYQVDARDGKVFVTERVQLTQAEIDVARMK